MEGHGRTFVTSKPINDVAWSRITLDAMSEPSFKCTHTAST